MTTDIQYAIMSGRAYQSTRNEINQFPVPDGWKEFKHEWDDSSGFEAVSFQNESNSNEIVISYAGTDSAELLGDWLTNENLGLEGKSCSRRGL